ncbi:hypothetical protein [Tepidibacillus decaturensis]|uniref:Uncharacterized protein n=1 Tax=Tepidibacillus decaturensis TaxID=1413211 RepID=A0A135L4H7_9BACI|nr:hypothetical protein [Tepidibacillus decaturensis]KXG43915.1 hypothetical protein U473_07775 [Tepidibacillus decaturensis]
MILEAMCQASPSWMQRMEAAGTPIYEYDEEWPVTIEVKNHSDSFVEARVLTKGSELHLFVIKCSQGYKLQWRDQKWTQPIDRLNDFTNDSALEKANQSWDPFAVQSIATAVRKIGESFTALKD